MLDVYRKISRILKAQNISDCREGFPLNSDVAFEHLNCHEFCECLNKDGSLKERCDYCCKLTTKCSREYPYTSQGIRNAR